MIRKKEKEKTLQHSILAKREHVLNILHRSFFFHFIFFIHNLAAVEKKKRLYVGCLVLCIGNRHIGCHSNIISYFTRMINRISLQIKNFWKYPFYFFSKMARNNDKQMAV